MRLSAYDNLTNREIKVAYASHLIVDDPMISMISDTDKVFKLRLEMVYNEKWNIILLKEVTRIS